MTRVNRDPLRKVVEADLQSGGKSTFQNAFGNCMPLGNVWVLRLECGHHVNRQPQYAPLQEGKRAMMYGRRNSEDALPHPARVRCRRCRQELLSS